MSYRVKLEIFEGPFDLLFHLIEKNEVDIYDIPIAEITAQYLEYLENMKHFDIEIASEFLVMAATLIEIKSKMLLPQKEEEREEEEDPRQQLVEKLIEYRKYKDITQELKRREEKYLRQVFREPQPVEEYVEWEPGFVNLDIIDLCNAFNQAMKRYENLYNHNHAINLKRSIEKEKISVADKIRFIMVKLRDKGELAFNMLFDERSTRIDVVITFLAILELIRLRKIIALQDKTFGDIIIKNR